MTHSKYFGLTAGLGATLPLALLLGCASTQAPKALVDARQAYHVAETGQAAKHAPDDLLEAQKLLAAAEQASVGSPKQLQLAYLADRQARFAESQGEQEMNEARLASAKNHYSALQNQLRIGAEQRRETAARELRETQIELAAISERLQSKDANLTELDKRRAELEQKQTLLEQKLAQTEASRADAEKRAQAALASLKALAVVKEESHQTTITLSGSVLFKTGKAELLPIAENSLDRVAEALKALDESRGVVVNGFTDSRGAEAMNQKLSQERADAVRQYLIDKGVNADRLQAVGKGEADPVASNDSAEGRANNRRVEIAIDKPVQTSSR